MKKFYLTLIMLFAVVTSISATDYVTSLDSLKNDKAYYITCQSSSSRGTWYFYEAHPDTLWGTKVAGVTASKDDPNCQFAFLKSQKGFLYFYSVGGKKFIHATGDHYVYLTDEPVSSQNRLVKSEKNSYPWVAQDNGYHFNLSPNEYCGLLSSWWSLSDKGNTIKIEPVADFDATDALAKIDAYEQTFGVVNITYNEMFGDSLLASYTQQQVITKGETVTFDGPQSFFGLKASNETPSPEVIDDDRDFSVTYNFETDEDALPFRLIPGDATAFPDDTPWYFMTIGGKYVTLQEDGTSLKAVANNDQPIDRHAIFCFNGNPIDGFYIHNMATDITKSVKAKDVADDDIYFSSEGTLMRLQQNVADGYEFSLISNGNFFMSTDAEDNLVSYNNFGTDCTLATTTLTFARVSDAELEMLNTGGVTLQIDSIIPAEGVFVGALDSIRIHYWNYIKEIKKDSPDNLIRVYNSKTGELIDSIYATVDPDDEACVILDMTNPLKGGSTYQIVIPENTIFGEDGEIAQGHTLTYTVMGALEPGIVTARVWGTPLGDRLADVPMPEGYEEFIAYHPVWDMIDYTSKGYFNTKIDVKSKNEVYIYGFTGIEGEDLDIIYTNDTEWGDFQYVNGGKRVTDEYGYVYWDIASSLTPDSTQNMGYIRVMADTSLGGSNAHCWPDNGYGYVCISLYDYEEAKYGTIYIDYYLDDRYNEGDEPEPEPDVITATQQSQSAKTYYTLSGQRISRPAKKGVYIVSGRKVLIK